MANPNILNLSSITAHTMASALTTSQTTLVNNNTSNSIYKINHIRASNKDGTNTADVTVLLSGFYLAKTVPIPADAVLEISTKDSSFYLMQGQFLNAYGSSAGDLDIMISYEVLTT
jgi:hypothetical protein